MVSQGNKVSWGLRLFLFMWFRPTSIIFLTDNLGKVGTHCKLIVSLFPGAEMRQEQKSETTSASIQNETDSVLKLKDFMS